MMKIHKILEDPTFFLNKTIQVNGWIKTCRKQKGLWFIHLNDGSTQNTLQVIAGKTIVTDNYTTGTSICVHGKIVSSPAQKQDVELVAEKIETYQICDPSFPLQKFGLTLDFQRTLPHLRHRTNIMRAMFKVKSVIVSSIHDYLQSLGYINVDIPSLTTNACESGCQPLQVTALLNSNDLQSIVTTKDQKIDYSKDFFGNPVYLTVSNQLHLECFAHGLGNVYTMTSATRGEPSQTNKHLAQFLMLEVESCFTSLDDTIKLSEDQIKYCASQTLLKCKDELEVLEKFSPGLQEKLNHIINNTFTRVTHRDAIALLKTYSDKFTSTPNYEDDLSGEHEKFLVSHFGGPVVVTHYPKAVKAFYMPVVDTIDNVEYVDCFDLLMDVGETVGGSQRIWNESELVKRMEELDMDPDHLKWYVDLRRYGSVPHGGFGIGIERLVSVITGISNIKDCISFPITVHNCTY